MATLGAILLVAFAALARSAGSPWLFDVGDWNGALWSVFARNFLRYGYAPLKLGQAYFAGPLPADVTYYTHHSAFITVILTEIYRLFGRSEEHTSELQSHHDLVCRLLLEKKKIN